MKFRVSKLILSMEKRLHTAVFTRCFNCRPAFFIGKKRSLVIFVLLLWIGTGISQQLPREPQLDVPFNSAFEFPAIDYHVKKLRCYSDGKLHYTAAYDTLGRIVRLESYDTNGTKPVITTWKYKPEIGYTEQSISPLCKTCTTFPTSKTSFYKEGSFLFYISVKRSGWSGSTLIDSTYIRWTADRLLMDSILFQNKKLVVSKRWTRNSNGTAKCILIDNRADIDYLLIREEYEYDSSGNKISYSFTKGGALLFRELYTYNQSGDWLSVQRINGNGILFYAEQMSYTANGNPLKRVVADSSNGFLIQYEEDWRYDEKGRWVWHEQSNKPNYFYCRYLNDSNSDYVELKRYSESLFRKTDITTGNIRRITNSVHLRSADNYPLPTRELENDTLFRYETIEEYDTTIHKLVHRIRFESDRNKKTIPVSEEWFEYDSTGRIIRIENRYSEYKMEKHFITRYQYNPDGLNVSTITTEDSEGVVSASTRKYNNKGQLLVQDSCRKQICQRDSFAYDSLGRMTFAYHMSSFREIQTYKFTYQCDHLGEIRYTVGATYNLNTKCIYSDKCLPISYSNYRDNKMLPQNYKWEYEFW